jgi:GDP-4-dehydro-6-deoxy-D-mannose reductase
VGFDRERTPGARWDNHKGDIVDSTRLRAILEDTQPDIVFHLAALTTPNLEYQELHRVNALGTLTLLNAVQATCPDASILITSSSAVYGWVAQESLPICEAHPFLPTNPYAVSKIAQEMIAHQQFTQHGLRLVRTRAFNLIGPGESARFVTSAFARQIAEIEANQREPVIRVGNLDTVRDFLDVRDAVVAYRLLAQHGKPGEVYNVCSGRGVRIRQLLDTLLQLSAVQDIAVQIDPSRLQPTDVPIQIGDASRLHSLGGWAPAIPLRQTLQDVLSYWRSRIQGG